MPQTSENPRKMKKMPRVIWSYFGNKLLNPEVQFIASRSINTPPLETKGALDLYSLLWWINIVPGQFIFSAALVVCIVVLCCKLLLCIVA